MPRSEYHPGPCRTDDDRWWVGHPEVVPLVEWANGTRVVLNKPDAILREKGADIKDTSIVFFRIP